MFTCLYSVLLCHHQRFYITLSFFFFFFNIYLIYAVFIRLVLHHVWQPFCCPFILILAAWVSAYRCLLASKGKKNVQKFFFIHQNKLFCVKIIVLFVFMIFRPPLLHVLVCLNCLFIRWFCKKIPSAILSIILPLVSSHVYCLLFCLSLCGKAININGSGFSGFFLWSIIAFFRWLV